MPLLNSAVCIDSAGEEGAREKIRTRLGVKNRKKKVKKQQRTTKAVSVAL